MYVSSSVPSFGCVPENTKTMNKHESYKAKQPPPPPPPKKKKKKRRRRKQPDGTRCQNDASWRHHVTPTPTWRHVQFMFPLGLNHTSLYKRGKCPSLMVLRRAVWSSESGFDMLKIFVFTFFKVVIITNLEQKQKSA